MKKLLTILLLSLLIIGCNSQEGELPKSFFKELSERNLDIKTITPADGILHIEPQWSYIGQDKYACISEEWYSEEELLAHWGVVYFTGKGILALPMYVNSEPHKTNHELTKQYLKNNFSNDELLEWYCEARTFHSVLINNLDLWSYIDQLENSTGNSNSSEGNNDSIVDNSTAEEGDYYGAIMSAEEYLNRANSNESFTEKYLNTPFMKRRLEHLAGGFVDTTMSAEEYLNRANSKAEEGDYYGAIDDYNKAIEINPNYVSAYSNRGLTYHRLESYYSAIKDYTKVIEIEPDFADAYYNRGNAKAQLEDYYGAIEDYNKHIELDPYYVMAYSNRGLSKVFLEDYYGAISDYTKVIEIDPNYALSYANRGTVKELLGDLKGACEDWKKAANHGHPDAAKWVKEECN